MQGYEASVFSLAAFAQPLPHPQYLIAPSIDPLSEKNVELEASEVDRVSAGFGLDPERPAMLQVSRFDRFKDPVGVIRAYRMVRSHVPVQLVLAGSDAADDKQGRLRLIGSRDGRDGSVTIHRDVDLYASLPGEGRSVTHTLRPGRSAWVQVARGSASLNGEQLYPGDGVAIEAAGPIEITGTSPDAEALLFDMGA